ncbi:ferrochelatase [Parvularcula dongshanensis]|uniref:Ferrochelatase n=2 Tax=Parvularcula dongshanensis TaxID=1173995 RepID=A0A840I167_9PROT|nr:ferrochelatase [Parvularcula dongshanensis]
MTQGRSAPLPPARLPENHPRIAQGKVGVLLVNLGTPEGTDAASVRRYLREFLSDRRVVDYPRALWLPVLEGIILRTRPKKSGEAYAKIWNHEADESPLRTYTREQANGVRGRLEAEGVIVDWAMRYGVPGIAAKLSELQSQGCDRILLVPLYPQYSATTTATVVDAAFAHLATLPWQPSIRTLPPFHDEAAYIDALAESARRHVGPEVERVILSYHGLPQRYFAAGDPYHCHCQKTSRLLREAMGWDPDFAPVAFQSKFGPEKWLEPSTESLVVKAAEEGKKRIAVMAPAFVSDCVETLEEIGIGLAETYHEAGGEHLSVVPCLNTDEAFLEALTDLVRRELSGWIPAAP